MNLSVRFDPDLSTEFRRQFRLDVEAAGLPFETLAHGSQDPQRADAVTWLDLTNLGLSSLSVVMGLIALFQSREEVIRSSVVKITCGDKELTFTKLTREGALELAARLGEEHPDAAIEIEITAA